MRDAVREAEIAGFWEQEEGCFCTALRVAVLILSYHHHSTGHTVIRVCCATTATHQMYRPEQNTVIQMLKCTHTTKVIVTHSYKIHAISIVAWQDPLLSLVFTNHTKTRPYSDVPALQIIKKEEEQNEELPLYIFDIDSSVLSLIGQLGFAMGGKKLFS